MTLERKNPLPIGRYWVDVPEADLEKFQTWLQERPTQIHVGATKEIATEGWIPPTKVTWYLFTVLSPVPWFGPGTPTIADANIQTADDTVDKPPPQPDLIDQLMGATGQFTTVIKYGAYAAAGLGAAYLLWKLTTAPSGAGRNKR